MHRVLLVAYHFPPEPAAGALRPGFLARYLAEFGWEPIVLTRELGRSTDPSCRIIAAPVLGESLERTIRRSLQPDGSSAAPASNAARLPTSRLLLRWLKRNLYFPDSAAGWIVPAIFHGLSMARTIPIDAVVSTAPPPTSHVVGAAIAALLRRPWIADFRDLWYGNPTPSGGPLRLQIERLLERVLIRRARQVTTISAALARHLRELHRRDVSVIPNALDPSDWSDLAGIAPRRFELCYTGSMYARSPALLFEGLAALREASDPAANTRAVFYGPYSDHVTPLAARYGVESIVEQRGTVDRRQALVVQREASTLLVFLNTKESASRELGSKIFEYVGARRPIIAFGPRNSIMRDYIAQRSLGWFASDVGEATEAIRSAHRRFISGELELDPAPRTIFEARDLAKAFAAQLDAVV